MLRDPGHCLALGLGSGLSPRAPGTAGSLLATLVALPLLAWESSGVLFALALVSAGIAVPLCGRTAVALGVHDHGAIVLDEFAGVWVALALVSMVGDMTAWTPWAVLLWFRVFDIAKPGPVGWLDRRLSGGLGIVADDLAAGMLACVATLATQAGLSRLGLF